MTARGAFQYNYFHMEDGGKKLQIDISILTVLKVVGVLTALAFLWFIRDIIMVIIVSVIFAALIEPLVNKMEEHRIPRAGGITLVYLAVIFLMVLVVRLVVPPMAEQVALLAQNFPNLWGRLLENFNNFREYTFEQGLLENIQQSLSSLQRNLQQAAGGVYSFIVAIFRNIINFVLVLVIAFYLVLQRGAMSKMAHAVSPKHYHAYLTDLFSRIQNRIGDWARGQLFLGLLVGILTLVGLLFVPEMRSFALMLALVAGLTELIPYLGPILGAIPAVFLAFTIQPFSVGRGIAVLILFVVIQQIENNILVPKVMQKTVGLNPVILIVVMLVGARLAGVVGIILAIPVATAVHIVMVDFINRTNLKQVRDGVNVPPAE